MSKSQQKPQQLASSQVKGSQQNSSRPQQQQQKLAQEFDPKLYVKQSLKEEDVIKIKECFDIFDSDKSGQISPQEMKIAINALGLEGQAQKILDLIADLDDNSDSQVDFEEFLKIFGFQGDLKQENTVDSLFKQFAQDKNFVNFDDFKRISEHLGERYSDAELQEMIEHAGKTKKGSVTREEFIEIVSKDYDAI